VIAWAPSEVTDCASFVMGEAEIGLDDSTRHVRCLTVGGAARRVGD
jgi:hypothetical protein